jgi:hypothetical protein
MERKMEIVGKNPIISSFSHHFPIIFPSDLIFFPWTFRTSREATDFFTELRKNPPKVRIAWVAQILLKSIGK